MKKSDLGKKIATKANYMKIDSKKYEKILLQNKQIP